MENKTANKKGGLYARVNMSVKSANIMVGVLVAALIIVSVFIVKHNGFTVKFDTDGGSYVAPVKAMYSETVAPDEPVKRATNLPAGTPTATAQTHGSRRTELPAV